jgi:nucleotide-binding universal stress UspA family protein
MAAIASILVGTDGSDTAAIAVTQAIELARSLGARLHIVSAYEPVAEGQLRSEQLRAPADVQWTVNPHHEVSHHAPCSVLIVRTS